jgi:hypothetical protein
LFPAALRVLAGAIVIAGGWRPDAVAAPSAAESPQGFHLQIESSRAPLRLRAQAGSASRDLEHRHVGTGILSPAGQPSLLFSGHPSQAVVLGSLPDRAPVTVSFWLRRATDQVAWPEGRTHPEYVQEHALGQGRLLSPMSGHPRDAARLSGILRVGPEGLQIWHGPDRWSTVIPGPLPAGQWMHLAVVFDAAGTATGYRDGRRAGATRSDFAFGSGFVGLAAAALDRGYGYPFAGALADFRLLASALSPDAVAQLAAPSPLRSKPRP